MSFYDDASLIFDASAAAGKDGTAFNLKPVEELTGPNKVINGGFDSDSDWSKGTGWSISGGLASCDGTQTGNTGLSQLLSSDRLEEGETYKVTYTISNYVAGQVNPHIRGTSTGNVNGNGTKVVYGIAGNSASYDINFFADSNFNASIDNVSIRKVVNKAADFTFTRGSNLSATRVGPDGFIEKGRENLLLQSNTFNTTWSTPSASIVGGQTGYDGSSDACLLTQIGVGGYVRQFTSASGVSTASVYVKAGSTDWVSLELESASPNPRQYFQLVDDGVKGIDYGSAYGVIDAKIELIANGWYRISLTTFFDISQFRVRLAENDGNLSGTSGTIYIQDAQLELGLVATDYIETGATTATAGLLEDEPRFDYTGGGCPALLMEPTRTNYVDQSEYFGAWTDSGATVTDNNTTSPEGLLNASKLQTKFNASSVNHQIDGASATIPSGAVSASIFAKKGNTDFIRLRLNGTSNQIRAWFDLSNGNPGTVDSGGTSSMTSMGDGWYRCTVTEAGNTNTSAALQVFINEGDGDTTWIADGDEYIYIYGAQLEEGSNATSYMPNYGAAATVTRDQDVTGELEHGITMGTTCSVFFEGKHLAPNIAQLSFFQLRTDDNNRLLFFGSGTTSSTYNFLVQHRVSGTSTNATSKALNIGDSFKVLARMDDTTMDVFINGELHDTQTITAQDHFGKMNLYRTGAANQSGHEVSQAILFTTALSNNDSEILTGATSYSSFADMATSTALNYTIYE